MNNYAFQPFYDKSSRVMILGSFPSVKSRQEGFYYGNKQNRFWKTLSNIFNESVPESIEDKKALLTRHHIALYDIVAVSSLKGSSDKALSKDFELINNLDKLLPPYTNVEKVICNGKLAYTLTTENFNLSVPVIYLNSTSPANPRYTFQEWENEFKFLK